MEGMVLASGAYSDVMQRSDNNLNIMPYLMFFNFSIYLNLYIGNVVHTCPWNKFLLRSNISSLSEFSFFVVAHYLKYNQFQRILLTFLVFLQFVIQHIMFFLQKVPQIVFKLLTTYTSTSNTYPVLLLRFVFYFCIL